MGPYDAAPDAPEAPVEVLLLDTLGELLEFYAAADLAFVGGSLVAVGGHNLLEPAALGVPVIAGPHQFNSPDVARVLAQRGALITVHDAQELARAVARLLADADLRARLGDAARAAIDSHRGAEVEGWRPRCTLERLDAGLEQRLAAAIAFAGAAYEAARAAACRPRPRRTAGLRGAARARSAADRSATRPSAR
jgi:hypothetical protein